MSNVGATGDRGAALTQQLSASEATRIKAQAYQRATSEILQVMAGSPSNVAPVFEAIVQSSAKLCEAEFSDYGAIGPATNLAARLCGEARDMQILMAPRIFAKLEDRIEVEPVGDLILKGFQRPIPSYNVLAARDEKRSPWRPPPMAGQLAQPTSTPLQDTCVTLASIAVAVSRAPKRIGVQIFAAQKSGNQTSHASGREHCWEDGRNISR